MVLLGCDGSVVAVGGGLAGVLVVSVGVVLAGGVVLPGGVVVAGVPVVAVG